MKKLIAIALLLNAFLLAGRFWQELDANAGTEPTALEMQVADLLSRVTTLEGEHPVDWSTLVNVPAGFADGLDDDSRRHATDYGL